MIHQCLLCYGKLFPRTFIRLRGQVSLSDSWHLLCPLDAASCLSIFVLPADLFGILLQRSVFVAIKVIHEVVADRVCTAVLVIAFGGVDVAGPAELRTGWLEEPPAVCSWSQVSLVLCVLNNRSSLTLLNAQFNKIGILTQSKRIGHQPICHKAGHENSGCVKLHSVKEQFLCKRIVGSIEWTDCVRVMFRAL